MLDNIKDTFFFVSAPTWMFCDGSRSLHPSRLTGSSVSSLCPFLKFNSKTILINPPWEFLLSVPTPIAKDRISKEAALRRGDKRKPRLGSCRTLWLKPAAWNFYRSLLTMHLITQTLPTWRHRIHPSSCGLWPPLLLPPSALENWSLIKLATGWASLGKSFLIQRFLNFFGEASMERHFFYVDKTPKFEFQGV